MLYLYRSTADYNTTEQDLENKYAEIGKQMCTFIQQIPIKIMYHIDNFMTCYAREKGPLGIFSSKLSLILAFLAHIED